MSLPSETSSHHSAQGSEVRRGHERAMMAFDSFESGMFGAGKNRPAIYIPRHSSERTSIMSNQQAAPNPRSMIAVDGERNTATIRSDLRIDDDSRGGFDGGARESAEPKSIRYLQSKRIVGAPQSLTSKPLVSVVIPCFNYAGYLPLAVQSVLDQAEVRTEIIIVDDRSTDISLEVARRLEAEHPNVIVHEHEVNKGPVDTFNDGLAVATGEYLVRLDADDLLTPGSLARGVSTMIEHPSVGLVYGHPIHFSGEDLPAARTRLDSVCLWPGLEWLGNRCRDGLNVITSPEVLMRKSVVDVVGGQEPLAHTHDMEMWMRIAAFSDVAYVRGCDQAWHRDHELSLSARKVDSLTDLEERRLAFDTLFDGMAGELPEAKAMRKAANRALDKASITMALHEHDLRSESTIAPDVYLDRVRSSKRRKAAEATIARHTGLVGRIGALQRRAALKFRTKKSFSNWHQFGEF